MQSEVALGVRVSCIRGECSSIERRDEDHRLPWCILQARVSTVSTTLSIHSFTSILSTERERLDYQLIPFFVLEWNEEREGESSHEVDRGTLIEH